jgi:tetratricopeptide (TPR) repeat protein
MSAVAVDAAAVESVDALKTRGNGLFSKGDSAGAITVYGEALAQLGESPRRGELAGSLLQNRALCYLKQKKYKECIADCDEALATAVRPKALYRRAMAREALGEEQEAFKDLKNCVAVDPKNLEAVKAARRLREVLSKRCEDRGAFGSPAVGMATRIASLNERYEDDRGSTAELFAAAAHRAADDASEAAVFWRSKAADVALKAAGDGGEPAFRFVSALASQGWLSEKPEAMAQVAELLTKKSAYFLEKPRTQITVLALAARFGDL